MNIRVFSIVAFPAALFIIGCGSDPNPNGNGGAGGTGGSGEVPSKDPAGPKNPDDLLKAAIVTASCLPDSGAQSLLQQWYTRRADVTGGTNFSDYSHCLATAGGGCAAVNKCLGLTVKVATTLCPLKCTGDVLSGCGDGIEFTIDCSKFDLACADGEAKCAFKTPGTVCDSFTFVQSCKNGAPFICAGPGSIEYELSGPSCADYGLTCGDAGNGYFACLGTGPACQPAGGSGSQLDYFNGISCNGAKFNVCMNGFEHEVDCGTLVTGVSCQTFGTSSFCGHAAECDAMTQTAATCEGDNVVLCNAGRIEKFDCKSLGFTGCNAKFGTCSPSIFDNF